MHRLLRTLAVAGVLALAFASAVLAQTLPPPLQPFPPTSPGVTVTAGDRVVEITRQVPFQDATTSVFGVPAGTRLVLTDVLITNPGTSAVCGVSIDRGTDVGVIPSPVFGPPQPGVDDPVTVTDSTLTGPLCVQARSTHQFILTTGVDFTAGQSILVANRPDAALPQGVPISVHLRGFLTTAAGTTTTQ